MDEGKRPGGLTWLAVLNFIGCAVDVLSVISLVTSLVFASQIKDSTRMRATQENRPLNRDEERQIKAMEAIEEAGAGKIALVSGLELTCGTLLLVAGIGYLKQRRWGRRFGYAYAVAAICTAVVTMRLLPFAAHGGFRFATLVSFLYPLLTILLLSTTFREDLQR